MSEARIIARAAVECERYRDALPYLRQLLSAEPELDFEAMILFGEALGNIITSALESYKTISNKIQQSSPNEAIALVGYKEKISEDTRRICQQISSSIENKLLPEVVQKSSTAFYSLVLCDLDRYQAKMCEGSERQTLLNHSQMMLNKADIDTTKLHPAHPIVLMVAYSRWELYSMKDKEKLALEMAYKKCQEVKQNLATLPKKWRYIQDVDAVSYLLNIVKSFADNDTKSENPENDSFHSFDSPYIPGCDQYNQEIPSYPGASSSVPAAPRNEDRTELNLKKAQIGIGAARVGISLWNLLSS